MDKISSFGAKEKEKKPHFSHTQTYSFTSTFCIRVRRADQKTIILYRRILSCPPLLWHLPRFSSLSTARQKQMGIVGRGYGRNNLGKKTIDLKRKRRRRENNSETSNGENGAKISTSRLRTLRRNGKTGSQSRLAKTSSLIR